jgi:hypothetical protein
MSPTHFAQIVVVVAHRLVAHGKSRIELRSKPLATTAREYRSRVLDGLPSPNSARLLRNYQALTNPQPVRYLLPLA